MEICLLTVTASIIAQIVKMALEFFPILRAKQMFFLDLQNLIKFV
jgi:hypothetical protein